MKKCPSCGAPLNTLSRFCEACGTEIPAEASSAAESATAQAPSQSTVDICTAVQQDLAVLASRAPTSPLAAFLTGLVTLPTVGSAYLVVKAASVFGHTGRSAERSKLALEQNLRTLEMSCKSDPQVAALVEKSRTELNDYSRRQYLARSRFLAGMAASLLLGLLAFGIVWFIHLRGTQPSDNGDTHSTNQITINNNITIQPQNPPPSAPSSSTGGTPAKGVGPAGPAAPKSIYPFKAAIIVENHAIHDLDDKVQTLRDILVSRIAGKDFAVLSPEAIRPLLNGAAPAQPAGNVPALANVEVALANATTAAPLASQLDASLVLYVAYTSFATETKKYTGADFSTVNVTYTLRLAYRLVETTEGCAIKGAPITLSKTVRQTENLQTTSDEMINQMLDEAAQQITDSVTPAHRRAAASPEAAPAPNQAQ